MTPSARTDSEAVRADRFHRQSTQVAVQADQPDAVGFLADADERQVITVAEVVMEILEKIAGRQFGFMGLDTERQAVKKRVREWWSASNRARSGLLQTFDL